ncbi:MAG: hypothetical protein DMG97_29600 [Acidobacteria bacterium]|nr:MAG: hypothetical protein DMG97_29600 [Acidobacteriota bacterium]
MGSKGTGQAGALLKGSDVPAGTKSITIAVARIRESPETFNAPAIIDLKKPIYGKSAWAVNKTNLKAIIKKFGDDEKIGGEEDQAGDYFGSQPANRRTRPELGCQPKTITTARWTTTARNESAPSERSEGVSVRRSDSLHCLVS